MAAPDRLPTVAELLMVSGLAVTEVLGSDSAGRRRVRHVMPGTTVRAAAELPAGTLVVFGRHQLAVEEVAADLAIRLAVSTRLAGIVAEHPRDRPIPEATRRLASKFAIPVVLLEQIKVPDVVAAIDRYVRGPEVASAELLRRVIQRLCRLPGDPETMLSRLSDTLGCPAALLDGNGHVVSGNLNTDEEISAVVRGQQGSVPDSREVPLRGGDGLVLHPAVLAPSAAPNLWLVARVPSGSTLLTDTAGYALTIAATTFTAHLALSEVTVEQKQRHRALLLSEILASGDSPSRSAVQHATALGWRLWGWHVGLHIGVRKPAIRMRASEVALALERALAEAKLVANPVARPDAWVSWLTSESEPEGAELHDLAARVKAVLVEVERSYIGLGLHAGLGRPRSGIAGIGQSLQEAREAALLAMRREEQAPVGFLDALNVRRLVVDWYSNAALQGFAASLLEPLWEADPSGDLVRTLACYLDHESSATATAESLRVHRNTVLYRMERVRQLLDVDLAQCDERLAVHLATRFCLSGARPNRS